MDDFGPYRIRINSIGGPEYQALRDLQMPVVDHADGKGFDLTVPRGKYFIAPAEPIAGLTGEMIDICRQKDGANVARLYSSDTIAFDERGALATSWSVSIEQGLTTAPSPPAAPPRGGHLRLVPKADKN